MLKEDEKCDLVVALNHVRAPDDRKMAAENSLDVLDMIFGGHDHSYLSELNQNTGVYIQKSGTDFEVFTNLTVLFGVAKSDFNNFISQIDDKNLTVHYSEKT